MASGSAPPFSEVSGDDAILNFIFSPGGPGAIFAAPPQSPLRDHTAPDADAVREADAVRLAEAGQLDEALATLNELCASAPTRASAFNNRAQVFKLMGRPDLQKSDVDTAIALARDWLSRNSDGVGPAHDRTAGAQRAVLQQALSQRAVYFYDAGDRTSADADLAAAAAYGSSLARMATAASHPYASICHEAVKQMLTLPQQQGEGGGAAPPQLP